MKLAIIGSRGITNIDLARYVPDGVTEIVSGGARGIDALARGYALKNKITLVEFLPKYELYGRAAPIKRNGEIAAYADEAIAFWDGSSRGTKNTIDKFKKNGKRVTVIVV